LKLSRELYGDNLPPAFDDVKSVGAQAAIFKLRYSSCDIQAAIFMTDTVLFGRRKKIAAIALARKLPSIRSFAPERKTAGLLNLLA
jgi:hypothetical protein